MFEMVELFQLVGSLKVARIAFLALMPLRTRGNVHVTHADLERGCIHIEQRNWRGDIDDPKTINSRRTLALGNLVARYEAWIKELGTANPEAWIFPKRGDESAPLWDSGVRQALKGAAETEGCDFPGFGPHSLRRANITLRQEVGGSAIEASKLAGHSKVNMTGEYTLVQLSRQDELTRKIQHLRLGKNNSGARTPQTYAHKEPAA